MSYTQPQSGPYEIDQSIAPTVLALFVGNAGAVDINTGKTFTRGSATVFAPCKVGQGVRQTAANTGIYLTGVPVSSSRAYVAMWHGVIFGTPTGSTPKLMGIASSTTSQGADIIGIEFTSATDIAINFKTTTINSVRTFTNSMPAYNVPVTIIAVYDISAQECRLHVCADGKLSSYSAAVSGGSFPTILGTEVYTVGPDVVEIPTRFTNSNTVLSAFLGSVGGAASEKALAMNPWKIFIDKDDDEDFYQSSGGGTTIISADFTSQGSSSVSSLCETVTEAFIKSQNTSDAAFVLNSVVDVLSTFSGSSSVVVPVNSIREVVVNSLCTSSADFEGNGIWVIVSESVGTSTTSAISGSIEYFDTNFESSGVSSVNAVVQKVVETVFRASGTSTVSISTSDNIVYIGVGDTLSITLITDKYATTLINTYGTRKI